MTNVTIGQSVKIESRDIRGVVVGHCYRSSTIVEYEDNDGELRSQIFLNSEMEPAP